MPPTLYRFEFFTITETDRPVSFTIADENVEYGVGMLRSIRIEVILNVQISSSPPNLKSHSKPNRGNASPDNDRSRSMWQYQQNHRVL
jgi:hypothetical protein